MHANRLFLKWHTLFAYSAVRRHFRPYNTSLQKTRKNAIVEYLDYQIPVTQLNGDMQAAKRD